MRIAAQVVEHRELWSDGFIDTFCAIACSRQLCSMIPPPMANALSVAGSNSEYKQPDANPAGFWGGLWHGLIAPFTFLISLFVEGVSIVFPRRQAGCAFPRHRTLNVPDRTDARPVIMAERDGVHCASTL